MMKLRLEVSGVVGSGDGIIVLPVGDKFILTIIAEITTVSCFIIFNIRRVVTQNLLSGCQGHCLVH